MDYYILRKCNKWIKLSYILQRNVPKFSPIRKFHLNDYSDEDCLKYFRFTKEHIRKLRLLFKIPNKLKCDNGSSVTGVEGLCMLLRRLSYPNRLIDMQHFFGREQSSISRICKQVLNRIYFKFQHLLECPDKPWTTPESLMEYCNAVKSSKAALPNCWGFIDGTVRPMCRPGRFQKEAYNGHKRTHALKYQAVLAANGIIVDLFGPIEGRRHDAYMLSESNLLEKLTHFKSPAGEQLCIYGDPAYPLRPQLLSPFKGTNLSRREKRFNKRMSKVRVPVEWGFGKIITQFAFTDYKKNQKLFQQPLSKMFKVSVILTNCHTCLYGSQTSEFFGLDPPSLELYLNA